MKTLVIVAHPKYTESTTQQLFKESVADDENVVWHLITETIDPAKEQALLLQADRIIFQFPLYWYSAPAVLKNWQDKVLTTKFATGSSYSLAGKELGLVVSTGAAQKEFQAGASEQFTMSEILRPYEALANKTKMKYLVPLVVYQFPYLTKIEQQRLFMAYQQYVTNLQFNHFSGQEEWINQRLSQKIEAEQDDKKRLTLQQIQTVLQDNQETLADLTLTASMIKRNEDE